MAIHRFCYECSRALGPEEPGIVLALQFWVFPESDAPEGAEETLETRPTLLCDDCAAEFKDEAVS